LLCLVCSYRKVIFGEGAKSTHALDSTSQVTVDSAENFWYCEENSMKICAEGAVANLLFHMHLREDAEEFRKIATMPCGELLNAMAVDKPPKNVQDRRQGLDPFEKCIWILEKKFNCRRFGYLNTDHFKTSASVVEKLKQVHLPVLMSVVGKHSMYNHVVVIWRDMIIDFESRHVPTLCVRNVEQICGPKNPFLKISRGCMILPSRKMKYSVGDRSDWGEAVLRDRSYKFWFKKGK
jgi:hypothetical protein